MDDVEGKAECDAAWTHVDCYGDVGRDNELAGSGDNGGVNDKLSPPFFCQNCTGLHPRITAHVAVNFSAGTV